MTGPAGRILVVEDNAGKRYTLSRHLRTCGYDVIEAETASDGLDMVRTVPDLVLLDVRLPDLDGFEVCRRIKADPLTSAVLVLALSAYHGTAADRVRGLDIGADAYLVHPVDLNELAATVRSLLRLRGAERERSRLLAAVAVVEQRHNVIAETATVGLVQTDPEGRCTFMNRAAQHITGYQFADLDGRVLHDMIHPTRRDGSPFPASSSAVHLVSSSGAAIHEHRDHLRRPDGEWIPVRFSASPIVLDGKRLGAVIEIKDDRDLVRAEQARELFLAALGHDLRGPLNTVSLSASAIERVDTLPPRAQDAVRRIHNSTIRMERLINQMLVFAQTLVQGVPLSRQTIDLVEVVGGMVRDVAVRSERQIELVGIEQLHGSWDADRLSQVLDNLLGNAVRHGDGAVTVGIGVEGEDAVVSIHNGGAPIPPAALGTLFDPFKRAGGRAGGVGLGLYIVDQIVKAHSGHIEVTSSVEAGTRFQVRLPMNPPTR